MKVLCFSLPFFQKRKTKTNHLLLERRVAILILFLMMRLPCSFPIQVVFQKEEKRQVKPTGIQFPQQVSFQATYSKTKVEQEDHVEQNRRTQRCQKRNHGGHPHANQAIL